ncbi:hypothetical protein NEMBOFW57_009684 [Staphylotrichum longicolle]|uniref:Uncharacterized protein n=1 Tax=Staphylotrichum longicolle TaxID=669026 RepID=A0AAD4HTJ2_9PEZI|nr:hypothetical protein NEMBOFW57_009684 [Staphylotrichum longicolle]
MDAPSHPHMAPAPKYRPPTIARGAIVWLPAKRFITARLHHLPSEVFDHPVLIFNIPSTPRVDVFLVTSFHTGESLIGRFQTDPDFRRRQLPIAPAPQHPDNGVLLALAGGRLWPKESYVSIKLFTVPVSVLREEQQGPWALSPASLRVLDDVVAEMPCMPTWKRGSAGLEEAVLSEWLGKSKVEGEGDDVRKEEEEGWVTVLRKRKRGLSVSS